MNNKLKTLDFTTASNACLSLRIMAEWVRNGDVRLAALPMVLGKDEDNLTLTVTDMKGR